MSDLPRILVVDDDQVSLELMHTLLKADYRVSLCIKSEDAMRIIERLQPDLVITDLKMPNLSGIELCQRMKSNAPTEKLPVIVYSGTDTPDVRAEVAAAGADYFIEKSAWLSGADPIRSLLPAKLKR